MNHQHRPFASRIAGVLLTAFALIMTLVGLALVGGGIWLIALGGSWYYAAAGIGLLATAWFLFKRDRMAVWLYLLTYAGTVIWALWERGLDGWAQVPRLVAPTVFLILVLAFWAMLKPRPSGRMARLAPAAAAIGIALLSGVALLHLGGHSPVSAQEAQGPQPSQLPAAPTSTPPVQLATADIGEDWPVYGGTNQATRFSPLDQITPDTVGKLKKVWTFRTGDMPSDQAKGEYSPETTPIKVGSDLFLCSAKDMIISLDAATGKERWKYDPQVPDDAIPYGATCRGVAYYAVPNAGPEAPCATRIIEGTLDARLLAVDAKTGQLCSDFGVNGSVNLAAGLGYTVPGWYSITAPITIVKGVAVLGAQVQDGQAEDAPSGVIRGFDAVSGKLLWAWDMGHPDWTGAPPAGQSYTRGTPNMWTVAAADEALGYVYLPLGNSAVDYYGGNRADFENKYSTSLVAVDVTTGKVVWNFQTVHYDVWDYDLGSQPTLVDFPTDTGTVPALILPSKQGQIYILNRQTGESLFPVEERPVPKGGVEADAMSPTQPFSTYHSLVMPDLTEADMWGMSPLDQLWCRIQFRQASYQGPYTPPTLNQRYIEYPGYNGGSDWGSVAVDTNNDLLVVNYNDMPNYNKLIDRAEADKLGILPINVPHPKSGAGEAGPQTGSPYAIQINAGWREWTGLMCKQPPYGGIRAIDLKTGKTVWDEPLGQARANGPFGIPSMLPLDIGTPNNGGPLVTAGGLIFVAATTDNLIRAIDIKTGKVVWTDTLPAGGQATPMSFGVDGRQYIGFMAGGHHFMETPVGDYVVAYALPNDMD